MRPSPTPASTASATIYPRGKILGGSSSINAMVYIRGHRADYEDWKAAGNIGWGWDEVLPAFKKMEDYAAGDPAYRGRGGPVHLTDLGQQAHPLCQPFIKAAEAAGLPFTPDFNGADQEGVGLYQFTIKGGRRLSAARAFLRPAMKRKNLKVETEAHVTRVLFEATARWASSMCSTGDADCEGAGGGDPLGRRHQLAAASATVRHRAGRAAAGDGHSGAEGECQCGCPHAGPSRHQLHLAHEGADAERRAAPVVGQAPRRNAIRADARGPLSLSVNQGGGFFRTQRGPQPAQHAALHAGLLDADPQGRASARCSTPIRSRASRWAFQLPAHEHGAR
jgi:choline dehydrogenase